MHTKRLLELADLLEKDAADSNGVKFDLSTWLATTMSGGPKRDCGTYACAIGLAMMHKPFRKEGFKHQGPAGNFNPIYGRTTGWEAVMTFFNLDREEANWLFSSLKYPDNMIVGSRAELAVAERIRKFVDTGGLYSV